MVLLGVPSNDPTPDWIVTTVFEQQTRIENIMRDKLVPDRVGWAVQEIKCGRPFEFPDDGTTYDHATDVRQALAGLQNRIQYLNRVLKENGSKISAPMRAKLQRLINRATTKADEISQQLDEAEKNRRSDGTC